LSEAIEALAVDDLGAALENARQERALAAEVVVDERHVDARRVGDVADRHAVIAALREQPLGGVEEPLLGRSSGLPGGHLVSAAQQQRRRLSRTLCASRNTVAFRSAPCVMFNNRSIVIQRSLNTTT